jgi:ribosomal-protein-alanine N-acetyltransferase
MTARAPELIETPRLLLRQPTGRDAEAIFTRYASDPEVTRYVGWPRHASVDETRAFLSYSDSLWDRWPVGPLLILGRDDDRLLGATGLMFETPSRAATGYVLAQDAWGRGLATEALGAMVDLARKTGVLRLYALCHHAHRASARVLEKADFSREGTLRRYAEFPNLTPGALQDVLCYSRILE